MTPVQIAADIKRLDKAIAKADDDIRATRDSYEPDLSAYRAGWHRSVWSAHATDSRGGSVCLNSFPGFLSGASAGVRPPRVAAAG
jgi:hypothetical protein